MIEKPLRIALIAHLRHPIASPFMGGMEAHSWHLARALVARGHDVTLLASGDSLSDADLFPVIDMHHEARLPWNKYRGSPELSHVLEHGYRRAWHHIGAHAYDIVHNNSLHPMPLQAAERHGQPMVTSLHVPPFETLRLAVEASHAPWLGFTACSDHHRSSWWPDADDDRVEVVANGLDATDWPFVPSGDGSAVWSGRITPNKGPHMAIDAARALGLDLTLFGVVEDDAYFQSKVAPRLGSGIRFGGHLGQSELAKEIGRASLCFFTPLWDEPFGLVAIEAMMCGVPVAALPNGAAHEVVGPCGAIAADVSAESLAVAGARTLGIPRAAVRGFAEAAFSIDRMIGRYERLYRQTIARRQSPGSRDAAARLSTRDMAAE